MRDRPKFNEVHREFERVANVNVSVINGGLNLNQI
jgi:hypothetical protein